MEQIRDLLAPDPNPMPPNYQRPKLEVKNVGAGLSHIPGLVEQPVQSAEEAWELLLVGARARQSAETKMNDLSSRSHCLLCVRVRGESVLTGKLMGGLVVWEKGCF